MRLPFELGRPLIFFDLETTGLSPVRDRIVELALIHISPNGDVMERVRRFNPGLPIPKEASAVHGITDADVADEAPFTHRARALANLLDPCDLAGFNIRRFDLPMLLAEFHRAGIRFEVGDRKLIDVQQIFHREEPRDLSAATRFYLGREHEDAHSALGDIRTSAAVLGAQMERYPHLPKTLSGLHDYCDEVRRFETAVDRWFSGEGENRVFKRGKHQGKSLAEVATHEADYLQWMMGLDDADEAVLQVVREALAQADSTLDH